MEYVAKAQDLVTAETITNCWRKTGILPIINNDDINNINDINNIYKMNQQFKKIKRLLKIFYKDFCLFKMNLFHQN